MALLKGKTVDAVNEEMTTEQKQAQVETAKVDEANEAMNAAMEAEQEQVEQTETEEVVETETEEVETETEKVVETEKVETEKVETATSPEKEVEKETVVKKEEQIIEEAQVTETETVAETEAKVEKEDVVESAPEKAEVVETKSTAVAEVETKSTAVAKSESKAVAANQVISDAADNGFDGLELGFGSFPMIKLENEGQFADSDENELGKHIRAVLQQSTPVYLYKQEGNEDGPIAYSYDRQTLTSYKGNEGDEFKTVEEVRAAWVEEGYDLEEKKYLEVVATIVEDHDDFIEGDVPEGLEDIEGETVMFRLAPASLKAFSGKVATLQMRKQPIQGATMDFLVGKKRKSGNGKTYFPWKFRLVK